MGSIGDKCGTGRNVTIDVLVENQGVQTETFEVTWYFDSGGVDTLTVTDLTAGNWHLPLGYPRWTCRDKHHKDWVDPGGTITEVDETDNECTGTTTLTMTSPPHRLPWAEGGCQ